MIQDTYSHHNKTLLVHDTFINLNSVTKVHCILEAVTYFKPPTKHDLKSNSYNKISNIRRYYIKDYFLITKNKKERVTHFLYKKGVLNRGRDNKYRGLYYISNSYEIKHPNDLSIPINLYINKPFFNKKKALKVKIKTSIKLVFDNKI